MYTFLDMINVDRTFHYETHFVEMKLSTATNYKKGRGNFHECFLGKFLTIKSTFFVVHFGDGGKGVQEKSTFCTLVKKLIIVNSP